MEQNFVIKANFCEQFLLPLGCQNLNMVNSVSLGFGKDKFKHFKTAFRFEMEYYYYFKDMTDKTEGDDLLVVTYIIM